jgi:hypothetical protein
MSALCHFATPPLGMDICSSKLQAQYSLHLETELGKYLERVGVKIEQKKKITSFYLQYIFAIYPARCKEHPVKAFLLALASAGEYVPIWRLLVSFIYERTWQDKQI